MKKISVLLYTLAILMAIGVSDVYAGTYTIDPNHSNISFSIKHLVFSNVRGHFLDYSGEITFDEAKKEVTNARAQIKTASIDTGVLKRDNHLRSADFFDVEKFPTITFNLKNTTLKDDKTIFIGDLTIHGVTKEVQLTGEFLGAAKDPWGNERIGFSAEGVINRTDFGIVWNKTLEKGGLLVGNYVKLLIEVECVLKK